MLLYVIRESIHPECGRISAFFTIDSSLIEHAITCRTNLRLREEFFGELDEKNNGNDSEAYDGDRYTLIQSIALQTDREPDYIFNLWRDNGFYLNNNALRITNKHWFDTHYDYGVGISPYHALLHITGYEDGWGKSAAEHREIVKQESLDRFLDIYTHHRENTNWKMWPIANGSVRFGEMVIFGAGTSVGKSIFNQNT